MEILQLKNGMNISVSKEVADEITKQMDNQDLKQFKVNGRWVDKAMYSNFSSEEEFEINNLTKAGGYICAWGWPHQRFEICGHDNMHVNQSKKWLNLRRSNSYRLCAKNEQCDLEMERQEMQEIKELDLPDPAYPKNFLGNSDDIKLLNN